MRRDLVGRYFTYAGLRSTSRAMPTIGLGTPYLVSCRLEWLLQGLRRGHAMLRRYYELSGISTSQHNPLPWRELKGYLKALGWQPVSRQ